MQNCRLTNGKNHMGLFARIDLDTHLMTIVWVFLAVLLPAGAVKCEDSDSEEISQVERTLAKFWTTVADCPGGETRGSVVSIGSDGKESEEGKFRLLRSNDHRFRFEFENEFQLVIVGSDQRCDYRTIHGVVLKDRDTEETLFSVAGITRRSSTIIAGLYVHGSELKRLKQRLDPSAFLENRTIDGHTCDVFEIRTSSSSMRYAIEQQTGELVLLERRSLRTQNHRVVCFKLQHFFPKQTSESKFTLE